MATFNLRDTLNKLFTDTVLAGGTSDKSMSSTDFVANTSNPNYDPLAGNILAPGAHTINLAAGDRVMTGDLFAFHATNPDEVNGGYKAADIFSFTLNIDGIISSAALTIDLQNGRGASANVITVGKTGVIGGVEGAIYAEGKTNITNSGLITSKTDEGFGNFSGIAIELNGNAVGSNIDSKSALTITNNAGGVIMGGQHAILHESLGGLTVVNKGFIIGSESDLANEGEAGALISQNGKVTLTNEVDAVMEGTVSVGWIGSSVTNKGEMNGTISAHISGEKSGPNPQDPLTGWIDFDRDGTASSSDLGDKHWNTLGTTVAMTVANTGIIDGTDNWENNGVDHSADIEVSLDLSEGKDVVTNSGIIYGLIRTRGGSDSVTNNALSKIYGDLDLGTDDFFAGYLGGKYALDDDTVINKGLVTGGVFTDMGKDILTNDGEIQGDVRIGTANYDAANGTDEDKDSLTNTGIIGGNVWTGLGDDTVTNSGRINNGLDTTAWPGLYNGTNWVWKNDTINSLTKDLDNDKDTVTNNGTIAGDVITGHGADKVTNAFLIDGNLSTGTLKWIGNGSLAAPLTAVKQSVFEADDADIIDNKGTVTGEIWTGLGDDTVTNSGHALAINASTSAGKNATPYGDVVTDLSGTDPNNDDDKVTNTGTVVNGIWTGVGYDEIKIAATGKVTNGGIFAEAGKDLIENLGYVGGDVHLGSGDAAESKITNGGIIKGHVFLGTTGLNKLINNKMIEGGVFGDYGTNPNDPKLAADGNNTIENAGVIRGDILLGSGSDIVTNKATGRIDGSISLGAGLDKFIGNATNETILDQAGNDDYKMGAGNDKVILDATGIQTGVSNIFDGEAGADTIDFAIAAAGTDANVNLSVVTAQTLNFSGVIVQTNTLKNFENVRAGAGNDTIVGSIISNNIKGGGGNDTIAGGKGQDYLEGGLGDDTFSYTLVDDSLAGTSDIIFDFGDDLGNNDAIDLVFVTGTLTEIDDFTAFTAMSGGNAQWRQSFIGGNTVLEINNDADTAADMVIYLAGYVGLTGADFV